MANPDRNKEAAGAAMRSLGRVAATLMTASFVIGTGIFGALGATAERAGNAVLLAMIPGGLVALATGLSGAQLGVNFPRHGGAFMWAREFHLNTIAFLAGCCYLGQGIVGTSVVALAFAHYSAQVFPILPLHLTAGAIVLAVIAMNSFGVGFTSKVLIGTVTLVIMLLGVVVAFSLPHVDAVHLVPTFDKGPVGFMVGAAIFFWAWDGFMRTAIMAGEIKDPRRTIPFAIIAGMAIAAAVYFAVGIAALGVLGAGEMAKDDVPLLKLAVRTIGPTGVGVVLAAA